MAHFQMIGKPDFDASADFVVRRGFTIGGVDLTEGQPLDKSLVRNDRVLEQLFNQRKIDQVETLGGPLPQAPAEPEVSEEDRLRTEYQAKFGRKAPSNMKIETLRSKVA